MFRENEIIKELQNGNSNLKDNSNENNSSPYAGKIIIQCPQCMMMSCIDEDDIVRSKTDEIFVNVGEVCQYCGNTTGYTVIGTVEDESDEELDDFISFSSKKSIELDMESLTDIQKKVINLRYNEDKTQKEIAKELGITESKVSQIEKNALEKIFK